MTRAHSSGAIRAHLRPQGIPAVIPAGDDQAGHRSRRDAEGGRPLSFDADDYKGGNVVERSINVLKHRRGLVTRCTLLVLTYRGGAVLRAITVWLKAQMRDMPQVPTAIHRYWCDGNGVVHTSGDVVALIRCSSGDGARTSGRAAVEGASITAGESRVHVVPR